MTTSTADLPLRLGSSWRMASTGMPRPSSMTVHDPSASMATLTVVAKPAIASSIELSTVSYTRWCRALIPVPPMYMPGRLRTASRPSRTLIWSEP